ncbi:related to GS1 protein [Cephalotrichum gorgonifer]|uniref:Related to GS1 protein n=1 Tax=Cephalotrichum gorgonifer TaxID=2041049 RepID=A0AAE8N1H5_9PEZI|nr:related to GS1 protein [Cephalotrichum gorgonifer]
MAPRTDFPPIRACLFDMDGLLLNTEDLYTECANLVLAKYNRPPIPWAIKAQLQGRPAPAAIQIFQNWAQLPISNEEYAQQISVHQQRLFPTCAPLLGVEKLLRDLGSTKHWEKEGRSSSTRVHVALATSSHEGNFKIKTAHLDDLFSVFEPHRRILGDDPRIPKGRGKPLPDIYLLALKTINDSLAPGEEPVKPEECLVFEDSVPGVEAGRRAGMRVIWCPYEGLLKEFAGREEEVLAGLVGEAGEVDMHQVGELGDGWAERLPHLADFPYERYGIVVTAEVVEKE